MTPDAFAIRLAELIGDAEDAGLDLDAIAKTLANAAAAIRESEAE